MNNWDKIRNTLTSIAGIEFGGPSRLFTKGYCELYDVFSSLDGVNMFVNNPDYFKGKSIDTNYNYYKKQTGRRYDADVTDDILNTTIPEYDFIVTSHLLEHVANPIKALNLWRILIKQNGYILIVVPEKKYCWDKNRDYTPLEHLILNYQNKIKENDTTHLIEIKEKNAYPQNFKNWLSRAEKNIDCRIIHHHCFSIGTLRALLEYCGFETICCFNHSEDNLQNIYLGRKICLKS